MRRIARIGESNNDDDDDDGGLCDCGTQDSPSHSLLFCFTIRVCLIKQRQRRLS